MPGTAADSSPGLLINHPRRYELFSSLALPLVRRRLFQRLAGRSGVRPGDRVLDIGCGTGALTLAVAAAVSPGGSVLGVDPSEPMVEHARRLAARRGANASFALGTAQELDAADGSFDAVVTSFAVHHVRADRRERAFAEMFRVLRPGGRLLVADFRRPAGRHRGMIAAAGFTGLARGRELPFARWITATRP
ncbi:class I SAM-dependent methyltransferase [Streptomyces radiopugnans]|uniref:Methyltransferase domain-containing protein n=1 Tax=Streptomyces radiopugnans TaxID=403935 RepID=A0A1H9B515_9ACTN|nr:class I SAM-dependent methyltransferase [Streptomyces radiopugnans]SEP83801.1 Methyltransferase domain-containing protein [Streptomyces radiopugnans]